MCNSSLEDKVYNWICRLYLQFQNEMMDTSKKMEIDLYKRNGSEEDEEKSLENISNSLTKYDDDDVIFLNGNPFQEEYGMIKDEERQRSEENTVIENKKKKNHEYHIEITLFGFNEEEEREESETILIFEYKKNKVIFDCEISEKANSYFTIEHKRREYSYQMSNDEIFNHMKEYIYEMLECHTQSLY